MQLAWNDVWDCVQMSTSCGPPCHVAEAAACCRAPGWAQAADGTTQTVEVKPCTSQPHGAPVNTCFETLNGAGLM